MTPPKEGSPPIAAAGLQGNDDATSDTSTQPESYAGGAKDSRTAAVQKARADERSAMRKAQLATTSRSRISQLKSILAQRPGNTVEAQEWRCLMALLLGPATTTELRDHADVLHPPGRVMALRRQGHAIALEWVKQPTSAAGKLHRVGLYRLTAGG